MAVIKFVGDVSLGDYYTGFGSGPMSTINNGIDPFSGVDCLLKQSDFVVGNLETCISKYGLNPNSSKSAVLRGLPNSLEYLVKSGFKVLQVANNHTLQHGIEAFEDTISNLESVGIKPIGLLNQAPEEFSINGEKVAFIAASDVPDNTVSDQKNYQELNKDFVERVKKYSKNSEYKLVVMLHWGLESSTTPLSYQYELYNELKSCGVVAVVGSHPHLFYEIKFDQNSVFAPSLGNFVFDLGWDKRLRNSAVLEIEIDSGCANSAKAHKVRLDKISGLPAYTGVTEAIDSQYLGYHLGQKLLFQSPKKLTYLLSNLFRGNTALKIEFIKRKIESLTSSKRFEQ